MSDGDRNIQGLLRYSPGAYSYTHGSRGMHAITPYLMACMPPVGNAITLAMREVGRHTLLANAGGSPFVALAAWEPYNPPPNQRCKIIW